MTWIRPSMFGLALATVVGLIPAMVHSASETLEEFKVDFEDDAIRTGTTIRTLEFIEFSGFVGLQEPLALPMIDFNERKAAVPAPAGNKIYVARGGVDRGHNNVYDWYQPEFVSVGCFTSPGIARIVDMIGPLSSVLPDNIYNLILSATGVGAFATSCTIRVRVVEVSQNLGGVPSLSELQAAGEDYIDCPFIATGVAGRGRGHVKECNLGRNNWTGIISVNFTVQSVDAAFDTGANVGIGAVVPVIDDFIALGYIPATGDEG